MENPGIKDLAVIDFSGVPGQALTPATALEGAMAVTLDFDFKWGSTGTPTGYVLVQTTFDGWANKRDIARFDFAQASLVKNCNLNFALSKGMTAYADLSAEGVYDGVMGSELRAVAYWTGGSYAGSTLGVRANVR